MLGDLNVHSIRWLTHSARESIEGRLLCEISDQLGLRQFVKEPTRGKHILDLVFTDVPDCTARPGAAVADPKSVLTQVKFKIPETASQTEKCGTSAKPIGREWRAILKKQIRNSCLQRFLVKEHSDLPRNSCE